MNIVDTIRNALVPIHREGWPFIAAFGGAAMLLGLFSTTLFWIGLILTAWCAYFFRDPERMTPVDDRLVVSPADGVISAVGPAVPPRELGLGSVEMTRVSVFMNVFSCHVNRAPVRGRITKIEHRAGKFLNAELDKASSENERNGLVIESPNGTGRRRADRRAGGAPHRLLGRGRHQYRHRRALRADPLRLARRRVHAGRRRLARRRRADGGRPARPCSPNSAAAAGTPLVRVS